MSEGLSPCPKCLRHTCISHAANIAHDLAQQVDPSAVMFVRANERAAIYALCDLVDAIEERPAAFWSSLTPAQALALLRAAPKVAGPREDDFNGTFRRGSWVVTSPSMNDYFIGFAYKHAGTAAMSEKEANADERLRAAGWLLVDEASK